MSEPSYYTVLFVDGPWHAQEHSITPEQWVAGVVEVLVAPAASGKRALTDEPIDKCDRVRVAIYRRVGRDNAALEFKGYRDAKPGDWKG